jgi:hypothetical protein
MTHFFLGGCLALFFMAQSWGAFTEEKEEDRRPNRRFSASKNIERPKPQGPDNIYFGDDFGSSPPGSFLPSILTARMAAEIEVFFPKKKKKKKREKDEKSSALIAGELACLKGGPSSKNEEKRSFSTSSASSVVETWLEVMDD